MFCALILLSLCSWSCKAAFYERVADVPKTKYDFVVVGGGTAGNVIANRLSENPRVSVLVLEAGGSDKNVLDNQIPLYSPRLKRGPEDWNYTTTNQAGLNGRNLTYPRGFVIGGSSVINGLLYTRGSSDDYDRYARVTGDDGWSWKNMQKYIPKNERFEQPVDHHNTSGQYNPTVHGVKGINTVSLNGYPSATDPLVQEAIQQLPEFEFNLDMNSGSPLGIGWAQSNIRNGERSTSSNSYLGPTFIARPNLHVLLHALVTKLLPSGSNSSVPVFNRIEITQDAGASFSTFTASKEIVLSAGTVNTPPILLHSGIGNATLLASLGITPLHNLPSVGQNLSEHPLSANVFLVNSNKTLESFDRDPATLAAVEERWNKTRTGPLVANVISWVGFFRLPKASDILKKFPDPSSGPKTPHYEFLIINGASFPPPATGNYLSMPIIAVQPTSRGYVTIDSANPLAAPIINPNILTTEIDILTLREAFLATRRFVAAPAFKNHIIREAFPVADEDIVEHLRNTSSFIFHPVATASMSPKKASWGVVDPDLRVKGVQGIRIVDASVFPYILSAHTATSTYLLAERASDIIKQQWKL